VIVSARGSDVNVYKDLALIRPLLRWTLLRAHRVITVSEALKRAIATLGVPEDKVAVIPNGIDSEKFSPMSQAEAQRRVGLSDGRVLLSVGHLTEGKGFDLLVRALKMLHQQGEQDLSLVLVGDGVFRADLEQLIASLRLSSYVRLVGAVPHQALSPWYNAADLFCLASAREGWPNVILEALACGTPVVATAVGGIPEILRSEKVGLLTERSAEKIAQSINRALRQSWKQDEIVQYARQYQWEHAATAIVSLFRDVLALYDSLSSTIPFSRERRVM
jgi:teichuronic acid biosynthesis glycosyltransferase TuaC